MSMLNRQETSPAANPAAEGDTQASVDAVVRVLIGENALSASLLIDPPKYGGAPPTLGSLRSALAEHGVSFGVDEEALAALEEKPVYDQPVLVARGTEPMNGKNGELTICFNAGKHSLKPKENPDGTVDYRDLDLIDNVYAGQVLGKLSFPTEGSPGMSVKGQTISQKKGRPVPACVGKNTELSPDGQNVLAKIDGQVDLIGQKICVNETYHVKGDVDMATGNIRAAGSLVIKGSVKTGFSIETGGSLDIYGTVESAKITAGGNIRLRSGIMGSELHCEGGLVSRFIENCNIFVKGDIDAEYVMHSNVHCGANLTTAGKRARVLGGQCVASGNITSGNIGSTSYVRTRVEISSREAILGKHQELLEQREGLEKLLESLKPLLTLFAQLHRANRITPDKQEAFNDVLRKQKAATEALEDVNVRLEEITESIHSHGGGKIICPGTIYPGTEITIGTAKYNIEQAMRNAAFGFASGEIYCTSAR